MKNVTQVGNRHSVRGRGHGQCGGSGRIAGRATLQTAAARRSSTANGRWRTCCRRCGPRDRARLGSGSRAVQEEPRCGVCHAFGSESEGTGLAPDLTGVASTFTRDFILQSILEPSATINGQFFHTKFTLKNGTVVTGSVIDVVDKKIVVAPVMMNPQATVEIAAGRRQVRGAVARLGDAARTCSTSSRRNRSSS